MPKTQKGNSRGRGGNRSGPSTSQPTHGGRRVWVGEVSQDAKDTDLSKQFDRYGAVYELDIINGASRHVRVQFENPASAEAYKKSVSLFTEHWVMNQSPNTVRLPPGPPGFTCSGVSYQFMTDGPGGPGSGLGPKDELFSAGPRPRPGYYLDLQLAPERVRQACKHVYASTGLYLKVPFLPLQGQEEIIGGGPRFWVCTNPEYFVHVTADADADGEAAPVDGGADDGGAADGGADDEEAH